MFNNNNPGFPFTAASASVAIPGPAPESTPRAALGPAPGSAPGSAPRAALGPAPVSATDPEEACRIIEVLYNRISELTIQNERLTAQNEKLIFENIQLTQRKDFYRKSSSYLKRKRINMECSLQEFKRELKDLKSKFDISTSQINNLTSCASEVPKELFEATAKRAVGGRDRSYHPALRKFAVSLHLCSPKAYRYRVINILKLLYNYFGYLNYI